jgi:hypothetical protein
MYVDVRVVTVNIVANDFGLLFVVAVVVFVVVVVVGGLVEEDVVVRPKASHVYGPLVVGVALVDAGVALKTNKK